MKGRIACWLVLAAFASQSAYDVRAGSTNDPIDDYKTARQAEQSGELGRAAAGYEEIRTRSTVLRKYADRRMALLARSAGNLMLERIILLRSKMQAAGDSIAVTRRLAENAYETGNNAEAVRLLTYTSVPPQTRSASPRDDAALLANGYLGMGEAEKARTIFSNLVSSTDAATPDDAAMISARGLDLLDTGSQAAVSDDEHLRRAAIYQANREFDSARKHFKAVADASPGGAAAADCLLQIGRGYALSSDPAEAVNWFERVLEQYPNSTAAKDALLQAASMYSRVGKPREAIKRYHRFIDLYPSDEKLDRAYLNLVDVIRDQGEDQEALKWCERTEAVFSGKPPAAVALFTAARIHLARGDTMNALVQLDRLRDVADLGRGIPGGTDRAEVDLMRGIAFERSGRFQEAVDAYLSVPSGVQSYCGIRAEERLHDLSKNDAARGFIDQKAGAFAVTLRAKDAMERRSAAIAVLRLSHDPSLRQSALDELKSTIKPKADKAATPTKLDPVETRFVALGLGDDVYPAGLARNSLLTATALRSAPVDLPADTFTKAELRDLYPLAHAESVKRFATLYAVDPRFVLAVMRQESGLDPFAHSNAAARGLMQLIMSTAATTAAETGRNAVTEDELFDPTISIELGTRHVADLFKLFPEQPEAVAAAYNAGADNVRRWVSRSRSNSPDAYVPEIMFVQTKDYVAKVMTNYRAYQTLYTEDLTAR